MSFPRIIIRDLSPREIKEPTVCIVRFNSPIAPDQVKAGLFFQVTIDPSAIEGEFIRFGAKGDELIGWQPVDFIRVCHLLAKPNAEGGHDALAPGEGDEKLGITIE